MTDFQSFRNAVLEDDDLQEASHLHHQYRNSQWVRDGRWHSNPCQDSWLTITSDEVYAHQDFLGQDGDLTDFELAVN